MAEPEYLTKQAFDVFSQQIMRAMEQGFSQLNEGIRTTHTKQDTTNGRLLKAEAALLTVTSANPIERIKILETGHEQLQHATTALSSRSEQETRSRGETRRELFKSAATIVGSILTAYIMIKLGLK